MSKRVVIYARISLDATGEGQAVARQVEACQKLAESRGWTVVAVESDNSISAYTGTTRPAWERVLRMIERREVDVVMAWAVDRLTRSLMDLERLIVLAEERGIGIATVTGDLDLTTDTGRMVARILAAVARAEVERKGARQRAANEQRARAGSIAWTRRPFGFKKDGTEQTREAEALRRAYLDVLLGKPINAIAREWNQAGIKTTIGGQWSASTVRQLLLAPRNAGLRTHNGVEVADGQWDAVVELDTFRTVERMLKDPKPGASAGGGKGYSLLRGMLRCSECGATMTRTKRRDYALYACVSKTAKAQRSGGCQTHRAEWLDAYVEERVRDALDTQLGMDLWAPEMPKDELLDLEAELVVVNEKLKGLAEDYALDLMTREQFRAATEKARERREGLEVRLQAARGSGRLAGLGASPSEVAGRWADLTTDQKRLLIEALVDVPIVCHPRGKLWPGNPTSVYDPSKIDMTWRTTTLVTED